MEERGAALGSDLEPGVTVDDDRVVGQGLDTVLDELHDPVGIALRLLQLGSRDPDGRLCWDGLTRPIQHLLRILIALQARQCQPQLRVLHTGQQISASRDLYDAMLPLMQVHSERGSIPDEWRSI